jgi:hypothetical protein
MEYHLDEAVVDLPEDCTDETIHVLRRPASDGSHYGLVINRQPAEPEDDLRALAEQSLKEQERNLRGYRLLGQRDSFVGGLPAIEAKLTWRHESGILFHHQAYVLLPGKLLIFTASSRAALAEECEGFLASMLASVRFRGPA